MKKTLSFLLVTLCLCTSLLFTACRNNSIDMNVYFKPTASAKIYADNTTEQIELSKIISSTPSETKEYVQTVLVSDSNWFYGMYVETITFCIYSNMDRDVEFDICLTGTENGVSTLGSTTKDYRVSQYACELKANHGYRVTLSVNDKITLSSSNSTLTIKVSDPYTEFTNNDFAYSIYGLQIVGYHK